MRPVGFRIILNGMVAYINAHVYPYLLKEKMSSEAPVLSLRERLARDNAVIQSIIDAIPPKYYFDRDVLDQLEEAKVKTGDDESKGFTSRKNFGIKAKHKRVRLNPVHQKTVTQIVQDIERNEKKDDEDHFLSPKGNIEELQQRLRKKIEAMQNMRHASGNKQALEVKRNIAKLKQKEKRKKKKYTKPTVTLPSDHSNGLNSKTQPSPTIFNKEGKLIYSKFDLSSTSVEDSKQRKPKSSLKRSMKDLEKKEEKIKKLEESSTEKAEEVKKKNLWLQALNKSEGMKVKDNPELLKKSLKRQEKRKKKSQKQWQNRSEQVEKKKQEKQEKRTRNIQKRKNEKLNSKLKRASKKGRLIPGF